MRRSLDRGSGSLTSLILMSSVVLLALGGLGGARVILRVTDALRDAENIAVSVATRAIEGDSTPCEPTFDGIERCDVVEGVATVRVRLGGVVASAVAGPDS